MSSISNIQNIDSKSTPSYGPIRKKREPKPILTRKNFTELCSIGTKVLIDKHVYVVESGLRDDNTVELRKWTTGKSWLADISRLVLPKNKTNK